MTAKCNISEFLPEIAEKYPDRQAIICIDRKKGLRKYKSITFSELDALSNSYVCEFRRSGIRKGMKILMMQKPGFDFIGATFAIFKIGAVPVLIDPGMGISNLLNCVRKTAPEALFAVPLAHWLGLLFPAYFRSVRIRLTSKGFTPPGTSKIKADIKYRGLVEVEKTRLEDTAAIVFTTGSTGPPKGVVYTHGIYMAQLEIIRDVYGAGPEEIDMPAFPLFALFSAVLGMTSVIPDFNPSKPAEADPAEVFGILEDNNVTFSFASPALWRNLASYCMKKNLRLKTLKKALMAGAPVPAFLHADMKKIMPPGGGTIVPYGATESLPVANFTGYEMLSETADKTAEGHGYCVGHPVKGIRVEIIEPKDSEIAFWDEKYALKKGEVGEIVVSGPVVTPEYYMEPEHSRNAKIKDSAGLWHRIGDMGYCDEKGRLWFMGRKAHRVITMDEVLYPVCCEAIFNRHPDVFRTALVGTGDKNKRIPVLIVEPYKGKMPRNAQEKEKFISELRSLGALKPFTMRISHFLFHPSFPVDIRHNAKIFREKLAVWAEQIISQTTR